jgi:hypothetical protein
MTMLTRFRNGDIEDLDNINIKNDWVYFAGFAIE